LLFGSLYFSEGLYQGLILIVTPLYLLDKGVPLPLVTLIGGIGYLPWGLKFVWGGIIDFYHKYGRKKFAIAGTMLRSHWFSFTLRDRSIFFRGVVCSSSFLWGMPALVFLIQRPMHGRLISRKKRIEEKSTVQ
jgi:hypothetical protein